MENLTHTLFGLAVAKSGLERATPLATATLVISSNLPDIDLLMGLDDTASSLKYHRGITHSFVGLAVLAAALTVALVFVDRRFRLRRDPFRRPLKPLRIFWIAYLGGLGHLFMDFTTSYGVRPLMPFSSKWFYGDMVFIADPWIWLILGSCCVWLTIKVRARSNPRTAVSVFWIVVGAGTAAVVALAFRTPSEQSAVTIPTAIRAVWFVGLAVIMLGAAMKWGRAGGRLARWSLFLLAVYYGALWMAHQTAIKRVGASGPAPQIDAVAAWPTAADPTLWQEVAGAPDFVFDRYARILPGVTGGSGASNWTSRSALDPKFLQALRASETARTFLDFARLPYGTAEPAAGGYSITIHDARYSLRLYARLDQELQVESAEIHWFR
jgi:inner membrane protein